MATDTIRRARSYARQYPNVPASTRLAWAREQEQGKGKVEWHWLGNDLEHASAYIGGWTIILRIDPDIFDDRSWLGEVIWRNPEPGDVPITVDRGERAHFRPANTYEMHRRDLQRLGCSKGEADRLARKYVREDARQYVEGEAYMLRLKALRQGIELGDTLVGGVEMTPDLSWDEMRRQFEAFADDLVDDVLHEARVNLTKLCKTLHEGEES